jgi:hypothetical protein
MSYHAQPQIVNLALIRPPKWRFTYSRGVFKMTDRTIGGVKMEISLGHIVTALATAGSVMFWALTVSSKVDIQAASIVQMRQDVADIRSDTKGLAGYQERLSALERGAADARGMFGSLDGRLSKVERQTDVNTSILDGITRASGRR